MDYTTESYLQQAAKLAKQAAAQMREAAALADQAAHLFQQALVQANPEQACEAPAMVQMSVPPSRRKKKQPGRTETIKLAESMTLRQGERFSLITPTPEPTLSSHMTTTWNEGDEWWKPL